MQRRKSIATALIAIALVTMVGVRTPGDRLADEPPRAPHAELGLASYYRAAFNGKRTASGERYDADRMTAAHRSLPFGTRVRVTNLRNGRSAVVRINDRGPWIKKRVIDVSYAAAHKLRLIRRGTARVRVEVLAAQEP
jgi:rare lipoprotein A